MAGFNRAEDCEFTRFEPLPEPVRPSKASDVINDVIALKRYKPRYAIYWKLPGFLNTRSEALAQNVTSLLRSCDRTRDWKLTVAEDRPWGLRQSGRTLELCGGIPWAVQPGELARLCTWCLLSVGAGWRDYLLRSPHMCFSLDRVV